MDGGDMMEVEVYKKRGKHWKRELKNERRKRKRRKNIERRE